MPNSSPVSTPLDKSVTLSKDDCPDTPEEIADMSSVPYLSAVGSLMNTSIFAQAVSHHPLLKLSPFFAHNLISVGSTSTIIYRPVAIIIPELYTRVHNSLSWVHLCTHRFFSMFLASFCLLVVLTMLYLLPQSCLISLSCSLAIRVSIWWLPTQLPMSPSSLQPTICSGSRLCRTICVPKATGSESTILCLQQQIPRIGSSVWCLGMKL